MRNKPRLADLQEIKSVVRLSPANCFEERGI